MEAGKPGHSGEGHLKGSGGTSLTSPKDPGDDRFRTQRVRIGRITFAVAGVDKDKIKIAVVGSTVVGIQEEGHLWALPKGS